MSVDHAVPSLVRRGLSADADLVYRTLVTFGPQGVRALARSLGVSARRAGAAVDELAAVRAVVPDSAGGGRIPREPVWRASPAADVVAELRNRKPRAVDVAQFARRHRAILDSIAYPSGLRANLLVDRATTRKRIAELYAVGRSELLSMHPERQFAPDAAGTALPLDRQALARGVRIRTCGVGPPYGYDPCTDAEELAALGEEYSELDEVPLKLVVFDRRVALLAVDPLNLEAGTLEIDHPAVLDSLVAYFEQLWSTGSRQGVSPTELTPRERVITGLLAKGHTDSSAAAHLGLSRRTIAYTMRALMDRVGVENRFQLGLVLSTRPSRPGE